VVRPCRQSRCVPAARYNRRTDLLVDPAFFFFFFFFPGDVGFFKNRGKHPSEGRPSGATKLAKTLLRTAAPVREDETNAPRTGETQPPHDTWQRRAYREAEIDALIASGGAAG